MHVKNGHDTRLQALRLAQFALLSLVIGSTMGVKAATGVKSFRAEAKAWDPHAK